ncbi:hypothetical protein X975_11642, partial [Stegodyphus mimosarum]
MRIYDRWMQEGTTDRHVRSHPPQCTTSRDDKYIVRMAVTDRSVTSRTIAHHIQSITHHPVSARTIRRLLQQSGLSARRPLKWNLRVNASGKSDGRTIKTADSAFAAFTEEMKAGQESVEEKMKAGQESVEEKMKASQESVEEKMKAGQESVEEKMKAGQESVEEKMKAGQESVEEKMKAGQESVEEKMKAGQESAKRK